jgi:hypothetical protein
MMAERDELHREWQQVVAHAWSDDAFKQLLLDDPPAALRAEGLPVQEGRTIKVVANTPDSVNLVLPAKPDELSDEELDAAAGGAAYIVPCWCHS